MSKHKILIIDDDKEGANIIAQVFPSNRFEVFMAYTAKSGKEKAFEQVPNIFLVDYALPDQTGLALCKEFRQCNQFKTSVFLINTCKDCSEEEIDGFHDVADGWIRKNAGIHSTLKIVTKWADLLDSL